MLLWTWCPNICSSPNAYLSGRERVAVKASASGIVHDLQSGLGCNLRTFSVAIMRLLLNRLLH